MLGLLYLSSCGCSVFHQNVNDLVNRPTGISKLLNLATVFLIFTTAKTRQYSLLSAHMTADVSHVQLVEIFHKSFVSLRVCDS
jgi:hypothetical protein